MVFKAHACHLHYSCKSNIFCMTTQLWRMHCRNILNQQAKNNCTWLSSKQGENARMKTRQLLAIIYGFWLRKVTLTLHLKPRKCWLSTITLHNWTTPKLIFSVRHKQPANVDQAVQYTLEAESYLHPHKQQNLLTNTLPITPLLSKSSVPGLPEQQQHPPSLIPWQLLWKN